MKLLTCTEVISSIGRILPSKLEAVSLLSLSYSLSSPLWLDSAGRPSPGAPAPSDRFRCRRPLRRESLAPNWDGTVHSKQFLDQKFSKFFCF